MPHDHVIPGKPSPQTIQRSFLLLAAVGALGFVAALLPEFFHAPGALAIAIRWVALCLFLPFVIRRRSLLLWTFFAMLAGVALGIDAPQFAAQTHFLGD